MTSMFQAIVHAVFHGFVEILPVGGSIHHQLLAGVVGWDAPPPTLMGALLLGTLVALVIYFRHDYLSIASNFVRLLLERRRPTSLDERYPFFMILLCAPTLVASIYLRPVLESFELTPLILALLLAAFAGPLIYFDYRGKKNRGMFDWTWKDCAIIGVFQIFSLIPTFGRTTATMSGALSRHFHREIAAKFILITSLPLVGFAAFEPLQSVQWHDASPGDSVTWLTFGVAAVVSFVSSLLAVGGFVKASAKAGFSGSTSFRLIVAAVVAGLYLWR